MPAIERAIAACCIHHSRLTTEAAKFALAPSVDSVTFERLKIIWSRIWRLDAKIVALAQLERTWQDSIGTGVTKEDWDITDLDPSQLSDICSLKGVIFDSNDLDSVINDLFQVLQRSPSSDSESAWHTAYRTLSEHILLRCKHVLSLDHDGLPIGVAQDVGAVYPPGLKRALTDRVPFEDPDEVEDKSNRGRNSMTLRSLSTELASFTLDSQSRSSPSSTSGSPRKNISERSNIKAFRRWQCWQSPSPRPRDPVSPNLNQVMDFVVLGPNPSLITAAIEAREKRALARAQGLSSVASALRILKPGASQNALLESVVNVLRRDWNLGVLKQSSNPSGRYYLHGLEGCSLKTSSVVRKSFFALLVEVCKLMLNIHIHPSTHMLALEIVMVPFRDPYDVAALCDSDLIGAARNLIHHSPVISVRRRASDVLQTLCATVLSWKKAPFGRPRALSSLQTQMLDSVLLEIRRQFESKLDLGRGQSGDQALPNVGEWMDGSCFQMLAVIFRLRECPQVRIGLSSKRCVETLISLVETGTPRVQLLSMRMLRFVLHLPESLGEDGSDFSLIRRAVILLLEKIGEIAAGEDTFPLPWAHGVARLSRLNSFTSDMSSSCSDKELFSVVLLYMPSKDRNSNAAFVQEFVDLNRKLIGDITTDGDIEAFKTKLRRQLGSQKGDETSTKRPYVTAILVEQRPRGFCEKIAGKVADRGFSVCIIPQAPDDVKRRNKDMEDVNPMPWLSGMMAMAIMSESVATLRMLATSQSSSRIVQNELRRRLSLLKSLASDDHAWWRSVASALVLLGGFQEPIRVGGRVLIRSKENGPDSHGVVLQYEHGQSKLKVAVDSISNGSHGIIADEFGCSEIPIEMVHPIDVVSITDVDVAYDSDVLNPLFAFIKSNVHSNSQKNHSLSQLQVRSVQSLCALLGSRPRAHFISSEFPDITEILVDLAGRKNSLSSLVQRRWNNLQLQALTKRNVRPHESSLSSSSASFEKAKAELSSRLPNSPLKNIEKPLPDGLSIESSRFLVFDGQDTSCLRSVLLVGLPTSRLSAGLEALFGRLPSSGQFRRPSSNRSGPSDPPMVLLGNAAIPDSEITGYYFEVSIAPDSTSSVSIGLSPSKPAKANAAPSRLMAAATRAHVPSADGTSGGLSSRSSYSTWLVS